MNEAEPIDVEGLIRARLERDAERLDPRPLFEKIRANLPGAGSVPERRISASRWAWVAAAAAASILAAAGFLLAGPERTALAKVETVVREARQAHRLPVDRCYLVEARRDPSLAAEVAPAMPPVRTTRLWTRGDRFWVEPVLPKQRWAWGRDESDRFWIAFGPHVGLSLEADEVPPWLDVYCDQNSLDVDQWLADVLDRFTLTREPPSPDSSTIRVHAEARVTPWQAPAVKTADFEIDPETRVVRRMSVKRVLKGRPFAEVTYTLSETASLDPDQYRVEGHLSTPFEVFNAEHKPERRKDLLARWFGPQSGGWFRSLGPPDASKRAGSPETPSP